MTSHVNLIDDPGAQDPRADPMTLLSPAEVAHLLGLSATSVYSALRKRRLHNVGRPHGQMKIRLMEIEQVSSRGFTLAEVDAAQRRARAWRVKQLEERAGIMSKRPYLPSSRTAADVGTRALSGNPSNR
jgi:hypothetical protein